MSSAALPPCSSSVEDYLERILALTHRGDRARMTDLARDLGVSQAGVSKMVRRLCSDGWVQISARRELQLTPRGKQVAESITRKHAVLASFFRHFYGDEKTIYRDVEGIEHHLSAQSLTVFETLDDALRKNPELARDLRRRYARRARR